METCSTVPRRASNFIVTAYTVVGDRLLPEMPSCCLAGEASKRCWLRIDRKRVRKTGPKFALCVVECKTHGHCFTLYPPGYVPYGRILIAPVASDQQLLRVERPASSGTELAWNRTIFRAAIDAAHGIAWPRQLGPGDAERGIETWRTQGRRITMAASLLGVLAEADRIQPAVAAMLGLPTLVVRDAAKDFGDPERRTYIARGQALSAPRQALAQDCLVERLATAGALVGLWGRSQFWDSHRAVLRVRGPP